MNDDQIVTLEISTLVGVSLGAQHFYGKLKGEVGEDYTVVDLTHSLTTKQARELSKAHGWQYKKGAPSPCFDTKDDIREAAKKVWRKHYPDAIMLVEGQSTYYEPKTILDYPEEVPAKEIELLNKMVDGYKEMDEILTQSKEDWKKRDELNAMWEKGVRMSIFGEEDAS